MAAPCGCTQEQAAPEQTGGLQNSSGGQPVFGTNTGSTPSDSLGSGGTSENIGSGGTSGTLASGGTAASGTGAQPAAVGGTTNGTGGANTAGNCAAPVTGANLHPGNFDYEACSKCHSGATAFWGGWLYNNAVGDEWLGGATVTLNNSDGTTVTAPTAQDGFFYFSGGIGSQFTPCVSKCPDNVCASQAHTSSDCGDSSCHGNKERHIYLTQSGQSTGGASGGTNCTPPTSGGARIHSAAECDYSWQGCRICHDERYTGGWVYDGLTSSNVVAMATITVTPAGGSPIVAVTGPGGMFFLGEVGSPSTFAQLTAPYTACVSKCPTTTICSASGTHTTTANCGDCHNETLRIYLR